MSCYRPLKGFRTANGVVFSERSRHGDYRGDIELPCGQCIGCRMRRASDWALRVMHEASLFERNCFVTLTYGRDRLPPYGSLCYADYQKFMKRLVKRRGPVRFYMCGEYGEETKRPHYHACLFGIDFRGDAVPAGRSASGQVFYNSGELERIWGHGIVSVQDLTAETASYCARYIMKKALGQNAKTAYEVVTADGEIVQLEPEFAHMSLKPGIGARWYEKYAGDVFPHDKCIQNGVERQVPKYYDKLLDRAVVDLKTAQKADLVSNAREARALRVRADNTDERRRVREVVHEAKVRSLKRGNV